MITFTHPKVELSAVLLVPPEMPAYLFGKYC